MVFLMWYRNHPYFFQGEKMSVFKVDEIEISYKRANQRSILPKIGCPNDAYFILHNQWNENRMELAEDYKMLMLNRENCVLGIFHISSGGTVSTVSDPKLIFVAALKANASSIILAHNHPSGNLKPSEEDCITTQQLMDVGRLLEIEVLDHLIITNRGCYSITHDSQYRLFDSSSCPKYQNLPVLKL